IPRCMQESPILKGIFQTQTSPLSLLSRLHYFFARDVPFLGAGLVCSATACVTCSFAFRYVGTFSHGLDRGTICFRRAVTERADSGWRGGIPYLTRYARASNSWS